MRGFLRCAAHDETVSGFGRDDAVFGLVLTVGRTSNGNYRSNGKGESKMRGSSAAPLTMRL